MNRILGVYGASGFGREVMGVVRAQYSTENHKLVFIDDAAANSNINGFEVVRWPEFMNLDCGERGVIIAIADSAIRQALDERCRSAGVEPTSVKAPNCWVGDEVRLAAGAILQPFVSLTANAEIGKCFHANIYSYVAHDCVIGDFVTFAPNVMCNGNIHIGDHAYIGAGAVLRQGSPEKPLVIGAGSVIGMGAVVTKDVPPGVTVVGNPARVMQKS